VDGVFMTRALLRSVAFAVCMALISTAAQAQSATAKPKSPGEIAAASNVLAKKYDDCRRESKQLKLSFFKRRLFIHRCVRK
jgi:hypothetical protein